MAEAATPEAEAATPAATAAATAAAATAAVSAVSTRAVVVVMPAAAMPPVTRAGDRRTEQRAQHESDHCAFLLAVHARALARAVEARARGMLSAARRSVGGEC